MPPEEVTWAAPGVAKRQSKPKYPRPVELIRAVSQSEKFSVRRVIARIIGVSLSVMVAIFRIFLPAKTKSNLHC
ncbi:hypothetical protein D3C71_1982270 [compost metagenome]